MGPHVPGLVGYWSFDEGGGQVAQNQASSGTPLYLTNVTWASGRIGAALRFNGQPLSSGGSLAWVSNANYQALPPAGLPFSLSLWFSPDALPSGWQGLLGNDADSGGGWHVALNTTGPGTNYLVLSGSGNGSLWSSTGRTLLLPGQWYRLTLSYANSQSSLYLDSRLLAQGAGGLFNSQGALFVGGAVSNYPGFQGRIDELRIYTNALSQEQISVTGQWHFDENVGSLATDSSILGHPAAVVVATAWVAGKTNSGIDLSAGPVFISNDDYRVLPPSGAPFSLSLWLLPRGLPVGRSGLLNCSDGTSRGWQLTVDVESSMQTWLELTSTNLGGTLALRAPVPWTNGSWTKLDLTYDGGFATVYVNGRMVRSDLGAIQAAPAPLILGAVPGTTNFNGVVDELKLYSRAREAAEIGPLAPPLWETALLKTSTSFVVPASGPTGKLLTYSILATPAPSLGTINYSPGLPIVTYVAGGQKGPDSFVYTVSDGEFISPPATGVVSVVQPHWLSPGGGTVSPLDGSGPNQAWPAHDASALDAIWRTNNYYDCFYYSPGEFQTTGWKYLERSTANPGCKHIGSGSTGPGATTIKLVKTWGTWAEGIIFAPLHSAAYCDGFEVRNLILDCNAENNPKYVVGEPVWLQIPLTTTARVDSVTLRWSTATVPGTSYKIGRPAQFTLCTRAAGINGYVTNCLALSSTGQVDVVTIGADTDEIMLQLTLRAAGVDLYGLSEMEVSGAAVSLPVAMIPGGGESRLDADHSILQAVDGDPATSWASGPESQVQITLPLAAGTPVSQVNFQWNCQTLTNLSRLGPAAGYVIYARDENSGGLLQVPFVSHGRGSNGLEVATFGTSQSTNVILTDQLSLLLLAREAGADYYSLREVGVQNGPNPTPLRVPAAMNTLVWETNRSILKAFDGDLSTGWASGTQGSVAAVEARGSNMKFTGLKVVGFGTKAVRECFPLAVLFPAALASQPAPFNNILVEDCLITQPATNNSDGLSALVITPPGPNSLFNASVRGCTVAGVKPYFTYSHGITAPLLENCVVDDCQVGVYEEPDPNAGMDDIGPVIVRSNQFLNVMFGIAIDSHPGARSDSLLCIGNEIVLADSSAPVSGIRICDVCGSGPSASMTNLAALNNIIRYPVWARPPTAQDGGLIYANIRHAVYGNNLVVFGTANSLRVRPYPVGLVPDVPPPEDCDHPGLVQPGPSTYPPSLDALPPGYRRAWYNNRDLSGVLLPVLYSEWGVDRPALQQQWPP